MRRHPYPRTGNLQKSAADLFYLSLFLQIDRRDKVLPLITLPFAADAKFTVPRMPSINPSSPPPVYWRLYFDAILTVQLFGFVDKRGFSDQAFDRPSALIAIALTVVVALMVKGAV